MLLYVCPDLFCCDAVLLETELLLEDAAVLVAGLRYAGGADLVTLLLPAGLTALPFDVVLEVLLTLVTDVLLVTLLLADVLLVPLPVLGDAVTADVLRLTLLLTPAPPLRELLPPDESLSEPV